MDLNDVARIATLSALNADLAQFIINQNQEIIRLRNLLSKETKEVEKSDG